MHYTELDEIPKERSNRKKIINKVPRFEASEKTSFGKENAKRLRKNDAKRIVNQYKQGLDDDEFDEIEIYERFGKR